jgi:hypothetical protein
MLACGGTPTDPTGPPDYVGEIVELRGDAGVLIKDAGDPCGVVFRVTSDSSLSVFGRRVVREDLPLGPTAQAWNNRFVDESCPAQTGAEAIVVGW